MRVALLIHFAVLHLALGDADSQSLDAFLRSLEPASYNVSQTLANSTYTETEAIGPHKAWYANSPPPASDELWCKAVTKGTTLFNAMSYTDADAGAQYSPPRTTAESPWKLPHLLPWGWHVYGTTSPDWCNLESNGFWGVGSFLRFMGISDKCVHEGGMWSISGVLHGDLDDDQELDDQTYTGPDDALRRVTGAEFYLGINAAQGGVIAFKRHGCADRAKQLNPPVPANQFPAVRQSSDMIWALWQKFVKPEAQANVNFFMSLSIENEQTLQIIRRALDNENGRLTVNGRIFDTHSEEGKAILGSPNAIGFAYFLIQHKKALGNKIIAAFHVMESKTSHQSPCMYISLSRFFEPQKPPGQAPPPQVDSTANSLSSGARPLRDKRNVIRVHTVGT